MKQLTEAQVRAFQSAMVPPHRRKYHVETTTPAETSQAAKNRTATRRAIEEHHEKRALRLEMEM